MLLDTRQPSVAVMPKKKLSKLDDPRVLRNRVVLRNALLELLEKKPLDQISVRDIAAKSGLGYTTYFRHYPNKEALFDSVVDEVIGRLFSLSLPVVDAYDLRGGATALFSYVLEHRHLWTTLLTGGAAGVVREKFLRYAQEAAKARSRPDSYMPADLGVVLIVTGTIETLAWWLRAAKPLPIEQIVDIHIRVVLTPAIAAGNTPGSSQGEKKRRGRGKVV
jgi:AcrR family transcriptional regulator